MRVTKNCSDACRGSGGGERNQREEEAAAAEAGNGSQLVMPEDGYEWKKYGQKFIKNIQKIRYLLRSTSIEHAYIAAFYFWHRSTTRGEIDDLELSNKGSANLIIPFRVTSD